MDIEELRAKCILLGVICSADNTAHHPWYARYSDGEVLCLPRKGQWLGRETERELCEDVLKHYGVYNEHDVHSS